jgi:calcineurin-like phosphoesterase family protein
MLEEKKLIKLACDDFFHEKVLKMSNFKLINEFDDCIFGYYNNVFICIKK